MFTWFAIHRNKKYAKEYNWDPRWLGVEEVNATFVARVKELQKRYGIKQDGLCRDLTYKLLLLEHLNDVRDKKY